MSSEYDFLDELLSDKNLTGNLPYFPYNETVKPEEPIKDVKVKSEYEIKLRKDNARLRNRLKAYSKALDDHGSRLTQLLKEKLAAQQEERSLSECQKKLEEAKLYIQATDQLNKQLTELVKNYEKGNKEYEEKINTLNDKMKGLKKSAADSQRRTDVEKQRRMKLLQILVELAEILIKYSLLPKKYKRRHLGWKHEFEMCGGCVEDSENCSEDDDEDGPEPTTLSDKINRQMIHLPKSLPSKENDSSGHGRSGLLEVISEDFSSGDETCKTDSGSSKDSTSTLARAAGVNALYDRVVGMKNNDLPGGDGSEIASNISSPYSLCGSVDHPSNVFVDSCASTVETLNSSLVSPSSGCFSDSFISKVGSQEKRMPLVSEGEDWGWTGDDLSGASLISNAYVPKKTGIDAGKVSCVKKPQGPVKRCDSTHLPKVSICEPAVFDILAEMCGRPPPLIKPLRDDILQRSESFVQKEVPIQANDRIDCRKDKLDGESIISRVDVLPAQLSETNDNKSSPCDTPNDLPVEKHSRNESLSNGNEKESAEKLEDSSVVQNLRDSCKEVQPRHCVEPPEENSCAPVKNVSRSDDVRISVDPSSNVKDDSRNQSPKKMPRKKGRSKKQKRLTKLKKSPKSRKIIEDDGALSSSDDLDTINADSPLDKESRNRPHVSERIPAHGLLLDDSLPCVNDVQSRDKEVMGSTSENNVKGHVQELDSVESTARVTSSSCKTSPEKPTRKGVCDREDIANVESTVSEETNSPKSEKEVSDHSSSVELPSESDETGSGRLLRSRGKTCKPVSVGKMNINKEEKENSKGNHKMLPKKKMLQIEDHPLTQRRSPRLNKDSPNKNSVGTSDSDMASPEESVRDVGGDSLPNSPVCRQTKQKKTKSQWRQSLLEKIVETEEDDGKSSSEASVATSNSSSGRRGRSRSSNRNQNIEEEENGSVVQTRLKGARNKQKQDEPKAIVSKSTEEGDAIPEICDKTVAVLQSSDHISNAGNAKVVSEDGDSKDTIGGHREVSGNSDDIPCSRSESNSSSYSDLEDACSGLDNFEDAVSSPEESEIGIQSDGTHQNECPSSLESERGGSSSSHSSVYAESESSTGNTSDVPSLNHKSNSAVFELATLVGDLNPSETVKNGIAEDQKVRNLSPPKENPVSSGSCSSTPLPPTKHRSDPLSISTFFSSVNSSSKETSVILPKSISQPCNEESCQSDKSSDTNEKPVGDAVSVGAQLSEKCGASEDLVPHPSTISSSGVPEDDRGESCSIPDQRLSPLKATYDSLLTQHIASESIQQKTTVLVQCNNKSTSELVRTDVVLNSTMKCLEEMLDAAEKRSVDQPMTESDSKVEQTETHVASPSRVESGFNFAPVCDKSLEMDLNFVRKPTRTYSNSKEMKFTSKTTIPFIFGRFNAFSFPGVKFRIAGSFSTESFSDPYSNPKMAFPNFGRGDFKEFYERCRAKLASSKASPDKPTGVKFVKKGAFSPPEFRDLYSSPKRPVFIMRHTRRNRSSSLTDNDVPSHARNVSSADCLEKSDFEETPNDCSSLALEFPVEKAESLNGKHSDKLSGIQLNDKTFVQAMECSEKDCGIDAVKSPPCVPNELVVGSVEHKQSEASSDSSLKSGLTNNENNLNQVALTKVSDNLDTPSTDQNEQVLPSDATLGNISGELFVHEKTVDQGSQALGSPENEESSEVGEDSSHESYDSLSNSPAEPHGGYPSEGYSGDGEDSPSGSGSSVDANEVDREREAEELSSEESANDACSADSFSVTNSCGPGIQVAPSSVTDLDISVADVLKSTNEIQIEGNPLERKDNDVGSTDHLNLSSLIDLVNHEKGASQLEFDDGSIQNFVNGNEERNDKIESTNDGSLALIECGIHEGQSSKEHDASVKSIGIEMNSRTVDEESLEQKSFEEVSELALEISTAEIEACKMNSGNDSNFAGEVSMPSDLENLIPEGELLLDDHGIDSLMVVVNGLMAESGQDTEAVIDEVCEKTDVIDSPCPSSYGELTLKNSGQEPSCASEDIVPDVGVKSDVKEKVVLDQKKSLDNESGDSESMSDLNSFHKKQKGIYRVVYTSDSENNDETEKSPEKTIALFESYENTDDNIELPSKEACDVHSVSLVSNLKTKMSLIMSSSSANNSSAKNSCGFTTSVNRDCNLNVDDHQEKELAGELVLLSGDKDSCRSGKVDYDVKPRTEISEGAKAEKILDTVDKEDATLSVQPVTHLSRGLAVMSSRCVNPRVTRVYEKKNVSQEKGVDRKKEIKDCGVDPKDDLIKKTDLVEKDVISASNTAVLEVSASKRSSKSGTRPKKNVSDISSSGSKSRTKKKVTKKIATNQKELFGSDLSDAETFVDSTPSTNCEKNVGERKGSVSPKDLFGSDFSDLSESEPVVDPTPIPKRRKNRKRVIYSSESQDERKCERLTAKRAKKVQLSPIQKQKFSGSDTSSHDPFTVFGSPLSDDEAIDSFPITTKEDKLPSCDEDGIHQVNRLKDSVSELQSAVLDDNQNQKSTDKVGNKAVNREQNEEEGNLKASSCSLKKKSSNSSEDKSRRLSHMKTTPPPSIVTPILDSQHTSNLMKPADLEEKTLPEISCTDVTLKVEDIPYFQVKDVSPDPDKGINENQQVIPLKQNVRRARKQSLANVKVELEDVVPIKRSNNACSGRRPIAPVTKVMETMNKSECKQEHNSTSTSAVSADLTTSDVKSSNSSYIDYTPPTKKRIAHIPFVNNLATKSSSPISEGSSSCSSDPVEDTRRVTRSSAEKVCKTNASSSKKKMSKLEKLRNKIARAKGIYTSTTTNKGCTSKEGKATDSTSCGSNNKNQSSSGKCGHALPSENAKDQVVEATSSDKDDRVGVKRKAEVKRKRSSDQNVPAGKSKKSNIVAQAPSLANSNVADEKLILRSETIVKPMGDSLIGKEADSPCRDLENAGCSSKSVVDTVSNSAVESEKDSGDKVSSPSEISVEVNTNNGTSPIKMSIRPSLPNASAGISRGNMSKTDRTEPVVRKRPSAKASGFRKDVFTFGKYSEKPTESIPLLEDSPGTSCESDAGIVTTRNLRKKPANRKSRVGAKKINSAGTSEDNLPITVAPPVIVKQEGKETDAAKACPRKGVKRPFPKEDIPSSSTRMTPEEILESIVAPPPSPLSDDKLVDALIIFPEAGTSSTDDTETNGSSTCNTADELNTDGVMSKSSKIVDSSVSKAEIPVDSKSLASPTTPDGQQELKGDDTNAPIVSAAPASDAYAPNDSETSTSSGSPVLLSEKLECLVWKREKSKDFFHNLLEEYREQLKKEKNQEVLKNTPCLKKQELKNQLNRLKGKHFNNKILDDLIGFINKESNGIQCKNVAKYLVRILSEEDEDDVESPIMRYFPRMSTIQLRTLSLVMALRKRCPKFHNLIEVMLSGISYILFRLGHAPEPEKVKTLSRVYAVFCKAIGDVKMLRVFCYDALFSLGAKAILVFNMVLSIWEQVLPKQSPERVGGHIETSIFMSILHHSIHIHSKEEAKINVRNLKSLVKKYYNTQHQRVTINDYLFNLMTDLRAGKNMNGLEAAIVLLAKRQGWDWTHRNLLCGGLVSVMEEWKSEAPPRKAAVAAIRLIGLTSRSCSMETSGPVKNILEVLINALLKEPCDDARIKEALVCSLIRLSKFNLLRVIRALDEWKPMRSPSADTIDTLKSLIKRAYPTFLKKKYRSWKKPVVNLSKLGVYFERSEPLDEGDALSQAVEDEDFKFVDIREEGKNEGGQKRKMWKPKKNRLKHKKWLKNRENEEWVKKKEDSWKNVAWGKRSGIKRKKRESVQKSLSFN